MPFYDRSCPGCDWQAIDLLEPVHVDAPACPQCGGVTVRAWLTTPSAVIGDEMDHVQINGLKTPRRFTSKAERKRWMKEAGYHEAVRHVGEAGTDRSKHTSNWAAYYDPYTAANAKLLIERAFHAGTTHEPDEALLPNARFYERAATPEEIAKYAR